MEEDNIGHIEVAITKRKGLGEHKALKILNKFLKKDQARDPEDQLPVDVLHQLQRVRDNLQELKNGRGAAAADAEEYEEEEGVAIAAEENAVSREGSHFSSAEKKRKKKKHKKIE